jgi:hypothetical protein
LGGKNSNQRVQIGRVDPVLYTRNNQKLGTVRGRGKDTIKKCTVGKWDRMDVGQPGMMVSGQKNQSDSIFMVAKGSMMVL